jgi:hypothetical protein
MYTHEQRNRRDTINYGEVKNTIIINVNKISVASRLVDLHLVVTRKFFSRLSCD